LDRDADVARGLRRWCRTAAAAPPNRCAGSYEVHRARSPLVRDGATPGARRRLDPVAWYPVARGCRFALIVFSHGHYGSPAACERLCSRLASQGFVVVGVRHADRATPRRLQGPERVEDVLFLLDHLPAVARGAGPLGRSATRSAAGPRPRWRRRTRACARW
jgi:predicted dienelactone hydrolase